MASCVRVSVHPGARSFVPHRLPRRFLRRLPRSHRPPARDDEIDAGPTHFHSPPLRVLSELGLVALAPHPADDKPEPDPRVERAWWEAQLGRSGWELEEGGCGAAG